MLKCIKKLEHPASIPYLLDFSKLQTWKEKECLLSINELSGQNTSKNGVQEKNKYIRFQKTKDTYFFE